MNARWWALFAVAPWLLLAGVRRPHRVAPRTAPRHRPWRTWTTARRARRVHRRAELVLPDMVDLLVLAVRSGLLPVAALRSLHPYLAPPVSEAVGELLGAVDRGTRLADALPLLAERLGPALHPVVDGFIAADRDGLPLAPLLERLAADARAQRRRRVDALARQLPVRLAAPLVVCSLPSFVLLAVVPLLLAAFASLHR